MSVAKELEQIADKIKELAEGCWGLADFLECRRLEDIDQLPGDDIATDLFSQIEKIEKLARSVEKMEKLTRRSR